jgi:hypothetical protein
MTTFLFAQGLDPVTLADSESFNKVRHRANRAMQQKIDYENGNLEAANFDPAHQLSFKTVDEEGNIGRISLNPEKYIGVGSDTEKDTGSGSSEE